MARFILIDRNSGYIFGDTADFAAGKQSDLTPAGAVALLNEHIGADEAAEGYEVYRADINGSEAVPVVQDGQDKEMIEAVQRDCEHLGFVAAE